MYDLSGRVALITGAGGEHGIGRAIATRLAAEGADVIVNDVETNPYADLGTGWHGIPDVVREIEAMGRKAIGITADVSDAGQVDNMVRQGIQSLGHIDILVNNAGSRPGRDRVLVVELEEDAWDTVQRVNTKGTFLCTKSVAREMIRRGQGGKIINISSVDGKRGRARFAAYCASKFAVIGFTEALSQELAPHLINVNAICPSLVDTERVKYIAAALTPDGGSITEYHAQMMRQRAAEIPMGRVAEGSDVAKMAAFLASGESDYVTGLSITVAGGFMY